MRPHAVMGSLMLTGPMTMLLIQQASVPQLSTINSSKLLRPFIVTHRAIWIWNVVALIPFVTSQVLVTFMYMGFSMNLLTILFSVLMLLMLISSLRIANANNFIEEETPVNGVILSSHLLLLLLLMMILFFLTHLLLCYQWLIYWMHYCMRMDEDRWWYM